MYIIAIQMLFGDKAKYLSMVVGITFASLIMTQQPSIFLGLISRTYSFIFDASLADIWVMDKGVQYVEEHKALRDTELNKVRGIKGVEWAAPLFKNLVRAKLPDGRSKTIDLTGMDDPTLVASPPQILQGNLNDLRMADAVIVDYEAANNQLQVTMKDGSLRPLMIGDVLEINDKRALVVGYAKSTRNFILQPKIYTSYNRAVNFSPQNRKQLTYILVKAKEGQSIKELTKKISNYTGLAAYSAEEFSEVTLNYWMKNTGIPINFGISVFLGFAVGAAIAGQTFFNFISENIKQYASLKAMGLRNTILAKMVVLQALIVGIVGYGIGSGITTLFGLSANDSVLAFKMSPGILLFAGSGVLIIVVFSALIAIRKVIKIDPAVVFRG